MKIEWNSSMLMLAMVLNNVCIHDDIIVVISHEQILFIIVQFLKEIL
jgi:hypothetical protein